MAQRRSDDLNEAAGRGELASLRRILDEGVSPNIPNRHGSYPILAAAGAGHTEVVAALIDAGADRALLPAALHAAAFAGHVQVVGYLASYPNTRDALDAALPYAVS